MIESNRYMVLGTADEAGVPWVTPVWYAQSDYRRFVWVSSPGRRHSRNVRARPAVSIVIFGSRVAVGSALAVYMSVRAEEPSGGELVRDIALFDTAGQAQGLTRRWALEDVLAPAPYRVYRATVSQHWVLDPDSSPDDRADVTLEGDVSAERATCAWDRQVAHRRLHHPGDADETGSRSVALGRVETSFARATNLEPPTGSVSPCAASREVGAIGATTGVAGRGRGESQG
jgi:hypothetical protein